MQISRSILFAAALAVLLASSAMFASPATTLNRPEGGQVLLTGDDDTPDVTDRVGRISFISGEVKIKRADSSDWERATLNLPVIEGDEIATSQNSRVELQFDVYHRVRLAESGYLKVVRLLDEGIALSVPQGTLNVRVTEFNKDRSYLEIDAPGTTVAVQKAGLYRIDAGSAGISEVRIRVTENGEARIYSETSGFTVRNGRSARVVLTGTNAGDWEPSEAAMASDEFDIWSGDRDAAIAKSLSTAYYDKYYDRDIYGADDLNDYGEWIYVKKYGYVWRPYDSATVSYAGWTPYRYGQWRWVPYYGWTWVNDEPWGWATYHHGRWFYEAGHWYWSPYGYYRYSRSWWSPALVVINIINSHVCWYPLPYSYAYFNFNAYYHSHGRDRRGGRDRPGTGNPGGTPTRTPPPSPTDRAGVPGIRDFVVRPSAVVPPTGVVSVPTDEFGRSRSMQVPPLATANQVLSLAPDAGRSEPILPVYRDVRNNAGREIVAETPRVASVVPVTGAAARERDEPLDPQLKTTRVLGGRPPVTMKTGRDDIIRTESGGDTVRTGAVDRPPRPMPVTRVDEAGRPVTRSEEVRRDTYTNRDKPPSNTPPRQEPPRREPPRQEPPRVEAPRPKLDTTRNEKPEPPRRTEQPPRSEAPRKPESKPEPKPSNGEPRTERKKDGR